MTRARTRALVAALLPFAAAGAASGAPPAAGKYSCIETCYRVSSGTLEYEPRGAFVLGRDGRRLKAATGRGRRVRGGSA